MSRIDLEKLIYKKPTLNIGLGSLSKIHNDVIVEPEPDPDDKEDPVGNGSVGTGGEGFITNP